MLHSLILCLVVSALITQVAVFSTTIFLHRSLAHHALVLHPVIAWCFRLALWLTTGIGNRAWVAIHRKHHAFTDKEGDPHSPKLLGFWSVQLGNAVHCWRAMQDRQVVERYTHDMRDDRWDRLIFNHGNVGITVGVLALAALIGPGWAALAAAIHAIMYVFILTSSINGLCHAVGYRNFDNGATNIGVLALVTGGEGLHNNHHRYPRSPKFSCRPREIDPAWPLIKLMIALRLATPHKTIEETTAW